MQGQSTCSEIWRPDSLAKRRPPLNCPFLGGVLVRDWRPTIYVDGLSMPALIAAAIPWWA